MYTFDNQVVWVTGSSTGIGRAAALAFARCGADVVVHANQSVSQGEEVTQQIEAMGKRALLVTGDVSRAADVARMVGHVAETFGRVDVLMNNAGSMVKRMRLEDMDEELWDRIMEVNLKSVFLVTKAVLPMMKAQGKGNIINVSSVAARIGGGVGSFAYAASKGGVSTMTRGMARDLNEYNIRVNAIAPGVISTPFHDRFSSPELRRAMAGTILLGREGTAEETVGAALFLASDYASYIVGETIDINGGQLMS